MKKLYVAVGGIACRLVKELSNSKEDNSSRYLYFDTDVSSEDYLYDDSDIRFVFRDYPYGTACLRSLGRDMFRTYLYSGEIPFVVDEFFNTEELQLRLITTAFGGFGSAVVFELADFLTANIFKKTFGQIAIDVQIIAFDVKQFEYLFANNEALSSALSINTLDFINEYAFRCSKRTKYFPQSKLCVARVLNEKYKELYKFIDLPFNTVEQYDVKEEYEKPVKIDERDVFISYSSVDQQIADLLVKRLRSKGIGVWIASDSMKSGPYAGQIVKAIRNAKVFIVILSKNSIRSPHVRTEINNAFNRINDGMVLMPILIEDTVLDDDCTYYLGAQEMFDGKTPPIEKRFEDLCEKIRNIVE